MFLIACTLHLLISYIKDLILIFTNAGIKFAFTWPWKTENPYVISLVYVGLWGRSFWSYTNKFNISTFLLIKNCSSVRTVSFSLTFINRSPIEPDLSQRCMCFLLIARPLYLLCCLNNSVPVNQRLGCVVRVWMCVDVTAHVCDRDIDDFCSIPSL